VRELKRLGANLLVLSNEYRAVHPQGDANSRFCPLFHEFEQRLSPTMRQLKSLPIPTPFRVQS
jgi:transposase